MNNQITYSFFILNEFIDFSVDVKFFDFFQFLNYHFEKNRGYNSKIVQSPRKFWSVK